MRDGSGGGGHGHVLERFRRGCDSRADPGRRLRHHDDGFPARPAGLRETAAADAAHRAGGDQEPGHRRCPPGAARGGRHDPDRGTRGGRGSLSAVPLRLRPLHRRRRVPGLLPCGVGLQQRRFRPARRQPHPLRPGPVGHPADRRRRHPRRSRFSRPSGAAPPQAPPPHHRPTQLDPAHEADAGHHRGPARRGHAADLPAGVEQLAHPGPVRLARGIAERVLPLHDEPDSGLQLPRHRGDARLHAPDDLHAHVRRRRQRGHRRRHQGHHVRSAGRRDHRRGAGRTQLLGARPPSRPARPAPGPDRGAARRRTGHDRYARPAEHHLSALRTSPLRSRLRLRHRRPVHRHHRRLPARRSAHPDPADVHRPPGPGHPGLGAGPARAQTPLRTSRGATRHW